MYRIAALIVTGLLAYGLTAQEGEGLDPIGKGKGTWHQELPDAADPWQEADARIPAYPKDKNLREIDVQIPDARYRFLVDLESVSIGSDNVVRYSVVIESASGVRNVYYEGIRCRSWEYKTYAFGTTDGRLRRTKGSRWRLMQQRGIFGFRPQLAEAYLCNNLGYSYERKEMMAKFKVAGEIQFEEDNPSWAYPGYQ